MEKIIQRFNDKWEAVTESGCWIWTGAVWMNDRYGAFWVDKSFGSMISAHRASIFLHKGLRLDKTQHVCHKCDTTLCVNPDHLFISDASGNMQDMIGKRRKHVYLQKLGEDQVQECMRLRKAGVKVKDIALQFGMSESQMSRITRGHRTYFNPDNYDNGEMK